MQDKRRYTRVEFCRDVVFRHQGRIIPAKIMDLSLGGMSIRADSSDVSSDMSLEVVFDLDDANRDISLFGRVRHLERTEDSSKFGVQFSNIFSEGQKAIRSFLSV